MIHNFFDLFLQINGQVFKIMAMLSKVLVEHLIFKDMISLQRYFRILQHVLRVGDSGSFVQPFLCNCACRRNFARRA